MSEPQTAEEFERIVVGIVQTTQERALADIRARVQEQDSSGRRLWRPDMEARVIAMRGWTETIKELVFRSVRKLPDAESPVQAALLPVMSKQLREFYSAIQNATLTRRTLTGPNLQYLEFEVFSTSRILVSELDDLEHGRWRPRPFGGGGDMPKSWTDIWPSILSGAQDHVAIAITEGKTDWKHIKAAYQRLIASKQVADMPLTFSEYENDDMGDDRLAEICRGLALMPNPRKVIFIFDYDNPKIIPEMSDNNVGYKSWGNNVYSLCIPIPAHRKAYQKISIEFYYTDEEVRTIDVTTGRRLFFDNEIESSGIAGRRNDTYRLLVPPRADAEFDKKIFDRDLTKIVDENGRQIAHSKSVFATNILTGKAGFEAFKLDAFVPLLKIIDIIVRL